MKTNNAFYIVKENSQITAEIVPGISYSLVTGEELTNQDNSVIYKHTTRGADKIYIDIDFSTYRIIALMWKDAEYKGYRIVKSNTTSKYHIDFDVPDDITHIAFNLYETSNVDYSTVEERRGYKVTPHYKKLEKKYSKESNQVFFRESLDGKINLYGNDYALINNSSLEDNLFLYLYKNSSLYATASFNKSDCKFNHDKSNVELGLTYNDKYTKILDAYDNTYDLIKLAPALTPITLTKRCVTQIYIQGENTISNYAGGTYWETEVNEQVNDANELTNHYHFARGPKYIEILLQGFNYNINAVYRGLPDSNIWNATSKEEVQGQIYKMPCSIKFAKVYSQNAIILSSVTVKLLSTGQGNGTAPVSGSSQDVVRCKYDTYRIEIYTGRDGTGTKIYQSDVLYGKDSTFILSSGEGLYPMTKISQPSPLMEPEPATFNLGEKIIEYRIWGRFLCDTNSVHTSGGTVLPTYDLPRDDFATPRRNYRKCVGVRGFDNIYSQIQVHQTEETSESPTSYGMNDFREYFIPPQQTSPGHGYFYPLSRSAWANTSMWVSFQESGFNTYEEFCAECYKEYSIKDVYHIGDAIKALLSKIDPSIKHEKTSEYSSFLYGHSGGTASILGGCDLYITQKTNILKGEYDQAAQKAEIKFKQLMDMLRDCFRCFWYIDNQNRFRIEHISYFMNGLSYDNPGIQLDLTSKNDKFNRKPALYCQRDIEYDKAELISRYEFKFADEVTKAMGGDLYVDVNNSFIKKDKTEEINIDGFTTDIDYMLFLPDDFSNDGFALLMADSNKKVPIVRQVLRDEKQSNNSFVVNAQNWYASFNNLIWHYMEDLSGNKISYNNLSSLYVGNIKRSMKQDIEFPYKDRVIDEYELIKTDVGNGFIEELSSDIDTGLAKIELRYEPD